MEYTDTNLVSKDDQHSELRTKTKDDSKKKEDNTEKTKNKDDSENKEKSPKKIDIIKQDKMLSEEIRKKSLKQSPTNVLNV